MKTYYTTTTDAIERSISHTEIARVSVPHALFALAHLISSDRDEDVDYVEVDDACPPYLDVWGQRDGEAWRIEIVSLEPAPAGVEGTDENDGPG